jgi:hypothetical protein
MARTLGTSTSDPSRGAINGKHVARPAPGLADELGGTAEDAESLADGAFPDEREQLRAENVQLRTLCAELEQALQEASQAQESADLKGQVKGYEELLEEKTEIIRSLHQQAQDLQAALQEAEAKAQAPAEPHRHNRGPVPREDELLALSEELERERRQLQEDEQSLMEQMRQMEVTMARERAEVARTRNDLQRLQSEIRHELDRLERHGALQSKMESLKSKFNDASARRGAAPGKSAGNATPAPAAQPATPPPAPRRDSIMGRLFGQGR